MKLQKLSIHNYSEIEGKKICCYEKSIVYLNELCEQYNVQDNLSFIIDDNTRNQGDFEFKGCKLSVCSSDDLQGINWKDYALIITSDYYNE